MYRLYVEHLCLDKQDRMVTRSNADSRLRKATGIFSICARHKRSGREMSTLSWMQLEITVAVSKSTSVRSLSNFEDAVAMSVSSREKLIFSTTVVDK